MLMLWRISCDQNCGGFWEVNVYRIRADVAVEVDDASWTLAIILIVGGLGYFLGGILLGMRARGDRKPSLKAHLHYTRWVQVYGLCQDGWAFCRTRVGMPRQQLVPRQTREPLVENKESPPSKRGSSKSKSSTKTRSQQKSSGHKGTKEKRRRAKDTRREKKARGEKLTIQEEQEEKQEQEQEEKERQLRELADSTGVHSSQAKIKVIGING